jgi:sulfur carrier protein
MATPSRRPATPPARAAPKGFEVAADSVRPERRARVRVTVNGQTMELAPGTTLADVVAMTCESDRGVAVAVGREVVPRSTWASVPVREGALIEVVTAAAGG